MNHRSMAFTILVFAMLIAIALGMFIATAIEKPSATGEVSQSPYIYLIFLFLLLTMGFLLSKILSGENSKFSYRTFINVSLAALLISGLAHELVHALLINHPVQLRFHFGDSNAILSTCCLSPGEQPYEAVAYGIQFLVLVAWMVLNRHTFYNGRFRELWKKSSDDKTPAGKKNVAPPRSTKKNPPRSNEMDEDDLEKEWRTHKAEMESHLTGKNKSGKRDTSLEDDMSNLNRLKA